MLYQNLLCLSRPQQCYLEMWRIGDAFILAQVDIFIKILNNIPKLYQDFLYLNKLIQYYLENWHNQDDFTRI
jgi:hypothetical protein